MAETDVRSAKRVMRASAPQPRTSRRSLVDWLRERFLLRAMRELGPLRVVRIALPGTSIALEVRQPWPADAAPFAHLPYWAEIWPSGVVLAGMIAREPQGLQGQRVLELGPGVGVTALAALRAGADLLITDSAAGALALCALNARTQVGIVPEMLRLNWRYPDHRLATAAGTGFSLVLAADVLYEEADVRPLVRLVERVLAPGGELWLAEPGRQPARQAVEVLRQRGWTGSSEMCVSPWPDPQEGTTDVVTVHRFRRPAASPPAGGEAHADRLGR